ncbi:hypothetical protein BG845_06694 [Pseudonocardia autotrophica]|uniref:Secreted protein n=1 Tax=Pseudonocardia autotrophica TaxID=2074 RepID=A0A1Y2MJG0_PSEAH|nr:hypothetical protein BG845_06694 [Pseudonocardia autotrophica]
MICALLTGVRRMLCGAFAFVAAVARFGHALEPGGLDGVDDRGPAAGGIDQAGHEPVVPTTVHENQLGVADGSRVLRGRLVAVRNRVHPLDDRVDLDVVAADGSRYGAPGIGGYDDPNLSGLRAGGRLALAGPTGRQHKGQRGYPGHERGRTESVSGHE